MKKGRLGKCLSVLLSAFLLAGCGTVTQIDDYATNNVEGGTEQTASADTSTAGNSEAIPKDEIKVGVIHLADPAEGSGYTYTHDLGIQGMQQNLGLSDSQIIRKNNVSDTDAEATHKAIKECIDAGCNVIFTTVFFKFFLPNKIRLCNFV